MIKSVLAVALAASSVAPALAAEAAFPADEPLALRVATRDLNLADPRDQQVLQARVDKAIDAACMPHGSYFATLAPQRDCRALLTVRASQQVAELTRKADRTRMADF